MFDISFSELIVIAIVALVVIGPEKLPKVARTAGAFFGRLQRFVAQVKDEVNRESRFAELQKLQEEVQSSLQEHYGEIERSILPASPPVDELAGKSVAKRTRKPRQAKAQDIATEQPLAKPRRRSKAASVSDKPESNSSLAPQVVAENMTAASSIESATNTKGRRPKKVKPASDTPDMFVDEPQS